MHFNAMLGGKTITPIRIADAKKNSSYWNATEAGTPNTALFFLKAAQPDYLKDAPGGEQYLAADAAMLEHGKDVFADTCARCHSSKGPRPPESLEAFLHSVLTTTPGWTLIAVGLGVGFLCALLVLAISVVSVPLLLDRSVLMRNAFSASFRDVVGNPGP